MITTVWKFKWIYCFGLVGMEKPFSRPSNTDFILSFEFWYSMTLDNTCRSIYFSRTPICKFLSWKRVHKQVSDSQGYKRWLLIQIKLKQVCSLSLLLQFSFRFKCIKSTLMMPWISVSFWTRDPQMFFFFSSVSSHLEKIRVNIEKMQPTNKKSNKKESLLSGMDLI